MDELPEETPTTTSSHNRIDNIDNNWMRVTIEEHRCDVCQGR